MNVEQLAKMIGEQVHDKYRKDYQTFCKNEPGTVEFWDINIGNKITAKAIPGPKYTKIDVYSPQQSGRYMVVNATGEIFGIKAYGVIHKGHAYGTLETADQWYWGEYTAIKKE